VKWRKGLPFILFHADDGRDPPVRACALLSKTNMTRAVGSELILQGMVAPATARQMP
jgi:hypothetical protein